MKKALGVTQTLCAGLWVFVADSSETPVKKQSKKQSKDV